jgi:preprotein translocase subunit SecD
VRKHPLTAFVLILIVATFATWIALPGTAYDVAGIKADHPVRRGLDLQGGLQVVLEANPPAGESFDRNTLDGTRDTIERRVNGLGVSEPLIQTRGDNQIIVELPGLTDPEQAIDVLKATALLEIVDPLGQYLPPGTIVTTTLGGPDDVSADAQAATAEASPDASPISGSPAASPVVSAPVGSPAGSPIASPAASPVASPVASPDASPIAAVSPTATAPAAPTGPVYETIIRGDDLADAFVSTNQLGQPVVAFRLTDDAADRFFQYTSTHVGQPMSIVIDKTVISSPVINAAISKEGIIEGVPPSEVQGLVVQLKAGSLAVPLEVVQSRTVGPTLGQDSIRKSVLAGIVGIGAVALFMILYYRLPGFLSVVALLMYTSIVFALFKLIPVTLTLAGIAGFILSIGMAVDANVLIFARMKEEMRTGRSLRNAIEAGFDHAWPSIRDSNVSSMITAAILYWFGQYTGASVITGFALTLFIGVSISFLSAITITRTLLRVTLLVEPLTRERLWFDLGAADDAPAAASAAD